MGPPLDSVQLVYNPHENYSHKYIVSTTNHSEIGVISAPTERYPTRAQNIVVSFNDFPDGGHDRQKTNRHRAGITLHPCTCSIFLGYIVCYCLTWLVSFTLFFVIMTYYDMVAFNKFECLTLFFYFDRHFWRLI